MIQRIVEVFYLNDMDTFDTRARHDDFTHPLDDSRLPEIAEFNEHWVNVCALAVETQSEDAREGASCAFGRMAIPDLNPLTYDYQIRQNPTGDVGAGQRLLADNNVAHTTIRSGDVLAVKMENGDAELWIVRPNQGMIDFERLPFTRRDWRKWVSLNKGV